MKPHEKNTCTAIFYEEATNEITELSVNVFVTMKFDQGHNIWIRDNRRLYTMVGYL